MRGVGGGVIGNRWGGGGRAEGGGAWVLGDVGEGEAGEALLTLKVLLIVGAVLLVRHPGGGVQDLLEALDPQGFVQVPFILLLHTRRPPQGGGGGLWLQTHMKGYLGHGEGEATWL